MLALVKIDFYSVIIDPCLSQLDNNTHYNFISVAQEIKLNQHAFIQKLDLDANQNLFAFRHQKNKAANHANKLGFPEISNNVTDECNNRQFI